MQTKILLIIALLMPLLSMAQPFSISGIVTDKESGKHINGANVYLKKNDYGTVTNANGDFKISKLKKGNYELSISFVGYKTFSKNISINNKNIHLPVELQKLNKTINDVYIAATAKHTSENLLKLQASLKDIPMSVATVNSKLLEQTQVYSINDALQYTTGIKPVIRYGGFQTFKMRGFGHPVIMIDGARDERMDFSNSAPVTTLAAVERIEYLKGPASVLHGHSAVGGIVNIVRKQPSNLFKANAAITYGSWETKRATLGAGDKINKKLSYRFDVGILDSKGWRNNKNKGINGYLALNYQINNKNTVELRFGGNNDTYGTETGMPSVKNDIFKSNGKLLYRRGDLPTSFKRSQRYNDPVDFLIHKNKNTSLKYICSVGKKSTLKVFTSYSDDLIDYFSTEELSYPTSNKPIYKNYFIKNDTKTYINIDTLQRTYPFRFSHETNTLQNSIDFSTKLKTGKVEHKLNIGHYFMYINRTTFTGYNEGDITGPAFHSKISVVNPILNQGNLQSKFSGSRIYKEKVNGLYLQDLIKISRKLNALAAVRFDNYRMEKQTSNISNGRTQTDISEGKTIINNALTYRFGLVYKPVKNLSAYMSFANFFKPKRTVYNNKYIYLNKYGKQFSPKNGEELFKPENGYQIEGGLKFNYKDKLQVNTSIYYINKNNIVEYLGKSNEGQKIYGQIGAVDSKGFDIDINAQPAAGLNIVAGYGLNIAKYKKFADNKYSYSKEGNYTRYNPKNSFFIWTHYQVQQGILKQFNFGAGVHYSDKVFTSTSNTYQLPAYWLCNTTIGYSLGKIYLKFNINNLFNKNYFTSAVYANQYVPGAERNFRFTIGINL
jgi:iron complex outermembrane receptor protein